MKLNLILICVLINISRLLLVSSQILEYQFSLEILPFYKKMAFVYLDYRWICIDLILLITYYMILMQIIISLIPVIQFMAFYIKLIVGVNVLQMHSSILILAHILVRFVYNTFHSVFLVFLLQNVHNASQLLIWTLIINVSHVIKLYIIVKLALMLQIVPNAIMEFFFKVNVLI